MWASKRERTARRRPAAGGRGAAGLAIIAAVICAAPAAAAGATPKGVALVTAPDSWTFTCFHENAVGGFECARLRCEAQGAAPCMRARWCFPARWSGLMRIEIDAFKVEVEFLCGAPSPEALDAMLAALCEADGRVKSCTLTTVWDPDGTEFHVEAGESVPAPADEAAPDAKAATPADSGPAGRIAN